MPNKGDQHFKFRTTAGLGDGLPENVRNAENLLSMNLQEITYRAKNGEEVTINRAQAKEILEKYIQVLERRPLLLDDEKKQIKRFKKLI